MKSILLLFFLIQIQTELDAQFFENIYSAQQISQGLSNTLSVGSQSLFGNPGGLTVTDDTGKIIASSEKRFWTEILGASLGTIIKIDSSSAIGVLIGSLGIDEYRESSGAFIYGRRLTNSLYLGLKFVYDEVYIDQYGRKGSMRGVIGLSANISSSWQFGFQLSNFLLTNRINNRGFIAISAGSSFVLSERLIFFTEIAKTENIKTTIKSGLTYTPVPHFAFFISILTNPSAPAFGLSALLPLDIKIHLGFLLHPYLGTSTGLSFIYKI